MYRQDSEFYIPIGTEKSIANYIRHLRYINKRERKHIVQYYDNVQVINYETDYQLIALRLALIRFEQIEPKGYNLLICFYYGEYPSIQSYATAKGISRQAMSKKIHRKLDILRKMAYEELDKLVS